MRFSQTTHTISQIFKSFAGNIARRAASKKLRRRPVKVTLLLGMLLVASSFIGLSLPYWTTARAAGPAASGITAEAWNGLRYGLRYFAGKLGVSYFAGTISGHAFQDVNADGVDDGAGSGEPGVSGIEVRAYDNTNTDVTSGGVATTDSNGDYTLTTTDAGSGPYRVEFSNLPSGFRPTPLGSDNKSSVRFITSTSVSNINFGVNDPSVDTATIEIGNRIWVDANRNGVQEASEAGLNGVTVQLYRNAVLVGTTTSATVNGVVGVYRFNDANVSGSGIVAGTGTSGGNSAYQIVIPNVQGGSKQAALGFNVLTLTDNASSATDVSDSDFTLSGNNAVFDIPYAALATAGSDHTFDAGFGPVIVDLAITKTDLTAVYTPNTQTTYTIAVTNNTSDVVTGVTVNDPLPAGISTANWTCTGTGGATCPASGSGAISNASVDLPANSSVTFLSTITIPAGYTGSLTNTATLTAPATISDPNTSNNTATDVDLQGLPTSISGTVFNDGNDDGTRQSSEVGFPYVVVKAYDSTGILAAQATSGLLGDYTINGLASCQYYRLEFELPSGYYDAAASSGSSTSVQFILSGSTGVKYGLHEPGLCLPEMNPRIVGGCAPATGSPYSVVSWRYYTRDTVNSPNVTGHNDDRVYAQVGIPQAFGADNKRQLAYFSTVSAPFSSFFPVAPDGRDAIYVANYSGPGYSFVSHKLLTRLTTDLGVDVSNQFPIGGGDKIGEYGLGGLDLSDDLTSLYVINQGKGNIAKLDISGVDYAMLPATAPNSVTEISIPAGVPNCVNGRYRPSALKFHNQRLYVGGVCDGATGTDADFAVKILAMDPTANTFTHIFSFNPTVFSAGSFGAGTIPQVRWQSSVPYTTVQPYVQDFGFDDTGSLIIGVMPRQTYSSGYPFGYWVRTWRNADGTFTLENSRVSGPFTSTASDLGGNGGPGGSWFLDQAADPWHGASYNGGVFILPGTGEVVGGFTDPWYCCSGGAKYASWRNGTVTASHVLAQSKIFTMTSVDQICEPGPMEIGNRIFADVNDNGIQDADEPGLAGVTVKLYQGSTLLATAVTSAQGQYIFKKGAEANAADEFGLVAGGLLETTAYEIRVDKTQTVLTGMTLAAANQDATAGGDNRDSDAVMVGSNAAIAYTTGTNIAGKNDHSLDIGFVPPPLSIGNTVWMDANDDGVINAGEVGKDGVLVELFYDANGNGTLEDNTSGTGSCGNNELVPVARQLTSGGGYYLFTARTDSAGVPTVALTLTGKYFVGVSPYNFSTGLAGAPATINGQAFMPGMIAGYQSSGMNVSGAGALSEATIAANGATDSDADNADDGIKQAGTNFYKVGVVYGVLSTGLMVMADNEPVNETTQPGNVTGAVTPGHTNISPRNVTIEDNDSNLTVDFGFYNQCLGDVVFHDNGAGALANNGVRDAGEPGIGGVPVRIYAADGTTEIPVGPDGILGTADDATGATNMIASSSVPATLGAYKFGGLPLGQYVVKIQALTGSTSSQDAATAATPDNNVDTPNEDDNGIGFMGGTVASNPITLTPGSAGALGKNIVNSATATTYNPTLDFSLILTPPVAVGNTVWLDTNNNGAIDAGEAGKDGALVELFFDVDGNGSLTGNEQTPVARQLTSGGGYYLFTQQTDALGIGTGGQLGASSTGRYFVGVSPHNFAAGLAGAPATIGGKPFVSGMLAGYQSSGTTIAGNGTITDTTVAANTDANADNADDGLKQNAASTHNFYSFGTVFGVMSGAIQLSENAEPVSETTLPANLAGGVTPPNDVTMGYPMSHYSSIDGTNNSQMIQPDENNVTVDFGFYNQKLGDIAFSDDGAGNVANFNNGTRQPGEGGVKNVHLKLFAQNGTTEIPVGPDGILGTADDTTGATNELVTLPDGLYCFYGLPAGNYRVEATIPAGYRSSADVATTANPNNYENTPEDDNGPGTAGGTAPTPTMSDFITLTPGTVNATEGITADNTTGLTNNPTLDFGCKPEGLAVGNTVWYDENNNGLIDATEKGIAGVRVELFYDANDNKTLEDNSGTGGVNELIPLAVQDTNSQGYYLFTQPTDANGVGTALPLLLGRYWVGIKASNFAAGGALSGLYSSATVAQINGARVETRVPGNGVDGNTNNDADENQDNYDDGLLAPNASYTGLPGGFYTGGVLSSYIDLFPASEPTNEQTFGMPGNPADGQTPGRPSTITGLVGGPPILDFMNNITVDFGFYSLSIGNLVFKDNGDGGGVYNNGKRDGTEPGIANVPVKLYAQDGVTVLATTTTDANGKYLFAGLPQGSYIVELDRNVPALSGLTSSKDTAMTPTPNVMDDDDNGVGVPKEQFIVRSPLIVLTPGDPTTTGEADQNQSGCCTQAVGGFGTPAQRDNPNTTDPNSDLKVDFGFIPYYTLGNRIWRDVDNDGTINAADGAAPGVNNVKVVLFKGDGVTPAVDVNDIPIPNFLSQDGGYYRFDYLPKGDYVVQIAAENFEPGKPLYRHMTSVGSLNTGNPTGAFEPPPDADATQTDSDDNGQMSGAVVVSKPVTLGETPGNVEPVNESDIQSPNPAYESPDNQSNLTVDFGFIQKLSLGNLVWKDLNNDGVRQALEPGVPNVTVELYRESNGLPGLQVPGDTPAGTTLTNNPTGEYEFTGLQQADYYVRVPQSSFGAGAPLFNSLSSSITVLDPNTVPPGTDNDDNGVDNPVPTNGGVASNAVQLRPDTEPGAPVDGDDINSNETVDFGFYRPLNIGNLVWKDYDGDGVKDANEPGIAGVTVELWRDDGDNTFNPATDLHMTLATSPVPDQPTSPLGLYNFTEIPAGKYFVRLAPSNFTGSGNLAGCLSTPGQDTGELVDNNDNGSDAGNPPTDGIVSGIVDVQASQEPDSPVDGDGTSGNQTIDFGLSSKLNLGNLVWKDQNNNGVYESATEQGVDGVRVELWKESNSTPGFQNPGDTFVAFQTTAGGGLYNFANLDPGDYYVVIPATQFNGAGALAGCYSSTPTANDPNQPVADGGKDNDDNGVIQGGSETTGGVASGLVEMRATQEPVTAVDTDGPNGNLTLDFGFFSKLSLGNLVFKDNNNNGLYEPALGEFGVNGVAVELFLDNGNGQFDLPGDTLAATTTTVGGVYGFANLDPGNYFIRVAPSNFAAAGALQGCASSVPTAANPNNDADHDDNGINDTNVPLNGIRSGLITLQAGTEPTNDGDGANSNQTIDFGFYPTLTLGNLVWKDLDNDGVKDANEPGVDGVQVMLYRDNGDNAFNPNSDALVAQQVTGGGGFYQFTGLPPGRYFVWVTPMNFSQGNQPGALFGCSSSTTTTADPNTPGGGVDNDDNGIDNANPATNGIASGVVDLAGNSEPDTPADGDGPNGNETVDFGFYSPLSLGNLIWKDQNNNGLADPSEPGVDGVVVQLYRDNGATPGVFDATDTPVGAAQTTAGGGLYNFTGLLPGSYIVRVMPSNFTGAGALAGCFSSTVTQPNADGNADNDDNGVDSATPQTNGIASNAVVLSGGTEPTNDGDGPNANETVDFGFYAPVSLGNLVWKDYNNNGLFDAATEPGINGVLVELYRETNAVTGLQIPGDAFVTSTTTATVSGVSGLYNFSNLLPGDYYVRVAPLNFQAGGALLDCNSSTPSDPTPNNNEDNDDNGVDNPNPATNGISSGVITLNGGTEPPAGVDGDGPNGNNTLDLGFYVPVNLGNRVWKDYNNDGIQQTAGANAEPGIDGVTVELYRDNGNGSFDGGDALVTSQPTAGGGFYNFTNLAPGSYIVRIPAAEFQPGGDLVNCLSSTPTDLTPNNNDDLDDNGVDNPTPATNGIATNAITLAGNDEPDTPADGDGRNGNLTLDLGFIPLMNLGNIVWKDFDNDGLYEPPSEQGINNVVVELFRDTNNNATFDPATDAKVSETTTQTALGTPGTYSFTGLIPATYFARLAPQNFGQNAVLAGCLSSTGADTTKTVDNNDNGVDGGNPSANGIVSNLIPLIGNSEPVNDGDGANGNNTVDFGLYAPVNLGNRVWKDNNNDGLLNNGEPGVDGVTVELFRDNGDNAANPATDTLVTTQTTLGGGYYNFANLQPGSYFVRISPSNFTGAGALAGCLSSEPTITDPNVASGGTDNDDNGLNDNAPQTNGIRSNLIDLQGSVEPTNDGDGVNGNLTLDFGFIPQMTIGNLVWKDLNNDGQFQAGEPGVANVTLNVYRETGQAAGLQLTGANADTLAGTTTSAASGVIGSYQFTGLVPGTYYVAIPAAEFASGDLVGCLSSEPTGADPNTDKDGDDNGVDNPAPQTNGIATGGITLTGGGEPSADGDGPNGNNTIDLGFIPQMSLGNVIWKDNNNDGVWQSSGAYTEPAVNNVTVELIRDLNANGQPDDAVYRTTTTAGGVYNFANLPPGNYFVRVPAAEFATGGDLAGCLSSTVTAADPNNPNGGADHDDDGLDNPTPQTNGIVTSLISLVGNSEPANDGDGPNGNQTIDLGFYPPMTLGNRVWKDLNNDGLLNNNEPGAPNVTVELWRETNGNTTLDVAGTLPDTLAASQVTNGNGDYNFANLTPGTYYVRIAPQEFQPNGDLYTCVSSTTTVADPNNPGGGVDNDDNGVDTPAPQTTGIASNAVVLVGGTEPTTDGDGPNGNNTVDFGFYTPLSVGNLVWKDNNNNGLKDTTEPGVANVRLELFRDNGNGIFDPAADSQIGFTTTNANGEYRFDNLTPGAYFVLVAQSNFAGSGALTGCLSSTVTAPDPNDPANVGGVDHNDDGVDSLAPQTNGIVTKAINLSGGTEPDAPVDGDGPNSNLTIDFGFYPPMSLGNLVWKDTNNNGLKDASESGVGNVVVELWRDDGNGTFDPGADTQVLPNQTSNASGAYQFTNLLPGDYFVRVAASNFATGGALADCGPSASSNPNPNDDKDNDNNAVSTPNGIVTGKIALLGNAEPPLNADGDGPNGNQTVDLGFTTGGMTLGNMVWKDTNANGLREATEPGLPNVKLSLYRDNGDKTFNKANDTLVGGTTTNAGGAYAFTGLAPADYFIEVDASNFGASGPLAACVSTVGAEPPNNDVDNDDNGSNAANPSANPPASGVISLVQNGEPDNDGDGKNGNLTVDFGFVGALSMTIEDPISCVGPGTVLNVRAEMLNVGGGVQQNNAGPEMLIALPATLAAVPGSASAQGGTGAVTIVNPQRIEWSGSLQPGERVVVTYRVQVAASALSGAELCIPSTANFDADLNGTNETAITIITCVTADCLPIGPGLQTNPGASVLFFPVYTSSPSNPNLQNTRISLTNANPEKEQPVHLFFVDGATCSVSDQYLCLTPNQTTSFVMSDLDPGVTGYAIAVAVNRFGCPVANNFLLGDEYVKFESGHAASLKAEGAVALPGGLPACQVGSSTAVLKFDGVSYSPLSRVVASSSLFDRASGNDAMLILNRLSGSAATGMDTLGSVFGILYDDAESAFSFSFTPSSCQFRSTLSNNFPRTTPRFEQAIAAGRTGWLRLWSQSDAPITGAVINRNPNAASSSQAYNQGHSLHTLTTTSAGSLTIPVFPPSC
jgi:uncharacterized repeat protein (TIGR01451 family)